MYARHRLDLGVGDLARLAFPSRRPPPPGAMVTFSVRSGFHLLLQALDLPAGSEVLVSAVTHPDMVRILEHHRLVAVPVDLDLETLAPRPELLERLAGPRTRLLLVAHLFGGRCDLEPALRLARSRGLLLVEDCAQAFRGPGDEGEPEAGVSFFSFGTLKTATALGGALGCVRDQRLRRRMAEIQAGWPLQPDREHRLKVLRHLGVLAATRPLPYEVLGSLAGAGFDGLVNGALRAFRPGSDAELVRQLERRPAPALQHAVARRSSCYRTTRLRARAAAGEQAASRLPGRLGHPGDLMPERTHWLFPVLAEDPDGLVAALRAEGFDAARAASSVAAVRPPAGRPRAERAEWMMSRLVYLPMYPEIPQRERARLLQLLALGRPARLAELAG